MMKFSIVTPSYNQSQFISLTIESVLSQKGDFEIEYFVMDGGSSDNSVEIIKDFEKKINQGKYKKYNKGIKFYWQSKKDKGQSDAINQGLRKATGDILAYINSDDSYTSGAFKQIADAFKKSAGKTWLTGYCNIINECDKPTRSMIASYKNFWLRQYSYNKLLVLNFISQPATFWKKEALRKHGLFDEKLHYTMDYDYWLKIGKHCDPLIVKEPLANFRIHNQSKGETAFKKQFDQDFQVCCNHNNNHLIKYAHGMHNGLIKIYYTFIKK